jgi:hypothetical protein
MRTYHTPSDAFAAQQTMRQYLGTQDALKQRLHFLRVYNEVEEITQDLVDTALHQTAEEQRLFTYGRTVLVTAAAMDLIDEAYSVLPSEVLLHQDLPYDHFVLWFERPLEYWPEVVSAETGEPTQERWTVNAVGITFLHQGVYRGIAGATGRRGTQITTLEEAEAYAVDGVRVSVYVASEDLPGPITINMNPEVTPYTIIDLIGVGFDIDWGERAKALELLQDPNTVVPNNAARMLHGWLIALFRLMGEHVELVPTVATRQVQRAAVRSGWKIPKDGYLSILRLGLEAYGRLEGESEGDFHLRWRHRVRGHWRHFYCPSRGLPVGDPGAYRYRYVNSFVRGPKDTPLIESNQVIVVEG